MLPSAGGALPLVIQFTTGLVHIVSSSSSSSSWSSSWSSIPWISNLVSVVYQRHAITEAITAWRWYVVLWHVWCWCWCWCWCCTLRRKQMKGETVADSYIAALWSWLILTTMINLDCDHNFKNTPSVLSKKLRSLALFNVLWHNTETEVREVWTSQNILVFVEQMWRIMALSWANYLKLCFYPKS